MDTNNQHVKSVQIDKRGKNRLKYASSRQRSKAASADVYRSYKRRFGNVTSAGNREEQIHTKKLRKAKTEKDGSGSEADEADVSASSLCSELDIALDRNGSVVFRKFHRELWPLVRSLPEIIHHSEKIVDCLLRFLLSNSSSPEDASNPECVDPLQVNLATTDILHLLAVLARDLRYELHGYLQKIMKRLLIDLISPPGKAGPILLDVAIVEATFRTLSYIFRYTAEPLVAETSKDGEVPCLESVRPFYSVTLAHRRDLVRRLAAESFAPLVRKLPTKGKKKHIRRVLRALESSSSSQSGPSMVRLQTDAIDGVSTLCHEVARGVSGHTHGKGEFMVDCLIEILEKKESGNIIFQVVQMTLKRLRMHLDDEESAKIGVRLVERAAQASGAKLLGRFLTLCNDYVIHKSFRLLRENTVFSKKIGGFIKKMLAADEVVQLSGAQAVELMCNFWRAFPDDGKFAASMCELLPNVLAAEYTGDQSRSPVDILAGELLQALSASVALAYVGSAILNAAGTTDSRGWALKLVHTAATTRTFPDGDMGGDSFRETDDMLFLENARGCSISRLHRRKLLDMCLSQKVTKCEPDLLVKNIQAASFLVVIPCDQAEKDEIAKDFQRVVAWSAEKFTEQKAKYMDGDDSFIADGVLLDCVSRMTRESFKRIPRKDVERLVANMKPFAEKLLLEKASSMWVLKALVSFTLLCEAIDTAPFLSEDVVFEVIVPNLCSKYYFRRLHSLKILCSFKTKHFVVDHAELDLADDLEEEASVSTHHIGSKQSGLAGACEVLDLLLRVEEAEATLAQERYIVSILSRVEVLGGSGKMPVAYVEATVSHLLGLLNVKFSPVWKLVVSTLVTMAQKHEDYAWPLIQNCLLSYLNEAPYKIENADSENIASPGSDRRRSIFDTIGYEEHFRPEIARSESLGRVSRHFGTDSLTVSTHIWEVMSKAPMLLVRNSRSIVPPILDFINFQYFALFSRHPDIRELKLNLHCNSPPSWFESSKTLDRKVIEHKFKCILRGVAAVKTPRRLFKQELLLRIFTAFVADRDNEIACLSLTCLLRFRLTHLSPFSEVLRKTTEKGGLRNALMELKCQLENSSLSAGDRSRLIGFLSRLLLGRILSQNGNKSSKDSPAARRNAVLSFLAEISKNDSDLYPFLYLSIRAYIPSSFSPVPIEDSEFEIDSVVAGIETGITDDFATLPPSLHIGFLNMLGSILSQLGHRAQRMLPAFVSITLKLSEAHEVGEDVSNEHGTARAGLVRGECYKCLGEILSRFQVKELDKCLDRVRSATVASMPLLREMCASAEKAPSLLLFLQRLSCEKKLIRFFSIRESCFPHVLACLNGRSSHASIECVLVIVDNLVASEEENDTRIVSNHFEDVVTSFEALLSDARVRKASSRQLDILCRASKLFGAVGSLSDDSRRNILQIWDLLAPFIVDSVSDEEKLCIIETLGELSHHLPSAAGLRVFSELGTCFGPSKHRPGIRHLLIRSKLADLAASVAQQHYVLGLPTCQILQQLCAIKTGRIEEADQDATIEALSRLEKSSCEYSWIGLSHQAGTPMAILPVVQACYHLMHSEDGVIARSSFKALKNLNLVCSREAGITLPSQVAYQDTDIWKRVLEGTTIRLTKEGLSVRTESIRRLYILLLADLSRCCCKSTSPHHFGDLAQLTNDNEPDLDFFRNITHVQLHRRVRALQRLRKTLEATEEPHFTHISFSNALLPICMHPIYEYSSKLEEPLASEAVATVGVISRSLSWGKYSNVLWTALLQIGKHPMQERFLIEMICSVLDNFCFSVCPDGKDTTTGGSVWNSLQNRIIPKVESLVSKEKIDHKGTKTKTIRATVVIALIKLFQQFPHEVLQARLPRLLAVVCDSLKSRESDTRDVARATMARIVKTVDLSYLPDVVRELAITLTEGYQLHVRAATVHSILLELSTSYKPSDVASGDSHFDKAVPGIVDLLQQDLFGTAQERKEAQDSQVRYVKEAGGSKSANSLEIMATMVSFKPSSTQTMNVSSTQALINPFLARLSAPGVTTSEVRRSREYLNRVMNGLSRNNSVTAEEALPFAFSMISRFVSSSDLSGVIKDQEDDIDDGSEPDGDLGIAISGQSVEIQKRKSTVVSGSVVEWHPATSRHASSAKEAKESRISSQKADALVADGASAPKLTGSNRHGSESSFKRLNDQSSSAAVIFGLQLINYSFKTSSPGDLSSTVQLVDQFTALLTACVCVSRDTEVILLSMKCIGASIRFEVPSLKRHAKSLARKTLEMLTSSANQEMTQACFKMLLQLINYDSRMRSGCSMALDEEQMQVLVDFLKAAVTDSSECAHALNLIKALTKRRFISPEFYSLMTTVLEQSVRSMHSPLRQTCGDIFVNFMLDYPLSEQRAEHYFKETILNLKYNLADGRLSAIKLVFKLLGRVPEPFLEKHGTLAFLPLTLQLVNDDSQDCRESLAGCIQLILKRATKSLVKSLLDFADTWTKGDDMLIRTALQFYGILADTRKDIAGTNHMGETVLRVAGHALEQVDSSWQTKYFALLWVEKAAQFLGPLVAGAFDMWLAIVECLTDKHPWVKLAATRVLIAHFNLIEPESILKIDGKSFIVSRPGSIFQAARKFCAHLDFEVDEECAELVVMSTKALTWIARVMAVCPNLATSSDEENDKDPLKWLITRLSNTARPKGTRRRQAVFKCFAALTSSNSAQVTEYLDLVLEALHRSEIEAGNEVGTPGLHIGEERKSKYAEESDLAKEVLQLLEERCDDNGEFRATYALVAKKAREKREKRKISMKAQTITDPTLAASRKVHKQHREKNRRKRRVEDRRVQRAGTAKRRHLS